MIRPFTFLCMVGALGSGLYLYQCKHQAQVLDREIARTIKQTEAARDRIGMLRAEWTQLNQPDRVDELARAHTTLQTAKPTQFVSVADLTAKLPAPVALPPPAPLQSTDMTPEEAAPSLQAQPQAKPVDAVDTAIATRPTDAATSAKPVAGAPARPSSASAEPARVAELHRPDAKPSASPVRQASVARSAPVTASVAAPVTATVTAPVTATVPVSVPVQVHAPVHHAAGVPVGASVLRPRTYPEPAPMAVVQPMAAPAYASAPVYASPAAAAQPQMQAPTGSVLGGSRSLPPPVPFAAR